MKIDCSSLLDVFYKNPVSCKVPLSGARAIFSRILSRKAFEEKFGKQCPKQFDSVFAFGVTVSVAVVVFATLRFFVTAPQKEKKSPVIGLISINGHKEEEVHSEGHRFIFLNEESKPFEYDADLLRFLASKTDLKNFLDISHVKEDLIQYLEQDQNTSIQYFDGSGNPTDVDGEVQSRTLLFKWKGEYIRLEQIGKLQNKEFLRGEFTEHGRFEQYTDKELKALRICELTSLKLPIPHDLYVRARARSMLSYDLVIDLMKNGQNYLKTVKSKISSTLDLPKDSPLEKGF